MSFVTDLEATIGSTLSDADKKTAISTWSHSAWSMAAEHVRSSHSSAVNRADIAANGTISNYDTAIGLTGADEYFGLDHMKSELRNKIKTNTSLFVYYGYIPEDQTKNRMLVVCDGKIYRFLPIVSNKEMHYFNMAKAGIPNYSASAYYTAQGDSTNATNSETAGDNAANSYHTNNDSN